MAVVYVCFVVFNNWSIQVGLLQLLGKACRQLGLTNTAVVAYEAVGLGYFSIRLLLAVTVEIVSVWLVLCPALF